jgi:ribosomal protein S27AE
MLWSMDINGAYELRARSKPVIVRAKHGQIVEGSYILGKSHYCPGCNLPFVADHPRRRYCLL